MKLFDIPGYQGKYKITDSGKIFSVARFVAESGRAGRFYKEKELKQQIDKYGYHKVSLCNNGIQKWYFVHRLIAITFLPNPNNLPCVNHKDENKLNNCVDNLEWCTKSYNHSYGTCIERTSEKQRLTHSNCITIVGYKENEIIEFHSISSASRYFNVSHAAISKAIRRGNKCKGYNWKYKI